VNEPRLQADGIFKDFGAGELFGGLSLAVAAGEAVVLRGPNGAGKSTLLGCLSGTVVPDRGTIAIEGRDLYADPVAARAPLRFLAQEIEVPSGVSGRELLEIWADVYGDREGLPHAAAVSGLGDALDRLATTYSVGMRRQLAFAGLVPGRPRVWVLDEPFAGVDDDGRARMLAQLGRAKDEGAAIVLATHGHDVQALDTLSPRALSLDGDTKR
jgi:ABC-type multidrug transport system ATPase subunit